MLRPDTWKLMVSVRRIRRDDNLRRYGFFLRGVRDHCMFHLEVWLFFVCKAHFSSSHTRHQSKGCWGSGKTNSPRIAAAKYSNLSRPDFGLARETITRWTWFRFFLHRSQGNPPCQLPYMEHLGTPIFGYAVSLQIFLSLRMKSFEGFLN